jgi:hypothetical protein
MKTYSLYNIQGLRTFDCEIRWLYQSGVTRHDGLNISLLSDGVSLEYALFVIDADCIYDFWMDHDQC